MLRTKGRGRKSRATPASTAVVKVQSGDTLAKVAAQHGVTIRELQRRNDLQTDRLSVCLQTLNPKP